MGKKSFIPLLIAALVVALTLLYPRLNGEDADGGTTHSADYTVYFPLDRFPETGKHIREAMEAGEPSVCTIDRDGAEENRKESLEEVPTKKGYDRDEWPMAMCEEGGAGADIAYVPPSDNRGAGSWIGNQLEELPDGSRVEFIIK